MSELPEPRRIVTGHDQDGNAIIVADSKIPITTVSPDLSLSVIYETHQFPASNDGWTDPLLQPTKSLVNPNGIIVRTVDFQPHTGPMMHRTESLDFAVVMQGELVCHLDNGVETVCKPGDVCVQRGTVHGWENRTDKPVRVLFVLSAAHPAKVGDKVLGAAGFGSDDKE